MLPLTARTRISELLAGPPALARTLQSTGLYREGDDPDVMLGELCWTFGFNPGILLMMLGSATATEMEPPLDPAPYEAMPLAVLVEHIETTHHAYLRESLPRLAVLTANAAAASPADEKLARLRDEVRRLAADLDAHLRHEEEALFPMVRDLGTRGVVTPTRCGGSVGGPIACMENEHHMTTRALGAMRELTDNYRAPDGADRSCGALLEELRHLDQDLQEHIYKENKVLFPRALEAQQARRSTARA